MRLDTPVASRPVISYAICGTPTQNPQLCRRRYRKGTRRYHVGLVVPSPYMRQTSVFSRAITSANFAPSSAASPTGHGGPICIATARSGNAIPTVVRASIMMDRENDFAVADRAGCGAQQVSCVAQDCGALLMLENPARDREVEVVPARHRYHRAHTPVLVDDIISTGQTMIETRHLKRAGLAAPVCLGVHAVFADRAYEDLLAAGAARVVTCNTSPHPSKRSISANRSLRPSPLYR